MPDPAPPARQGHLTEPDGGRGKGRSRHLTVGLAVAVAGGIAAVAFMAFAASPGSAPAGLQGVAAQGDGTADGPDLQVPAPSGNATGAAPTPTVPSLPTPTLPSLPS